MNNQQPNYWCHQCNCRVKAISSLDDGEPICPICKESFVELLEESQNSNNNNNSSSTNQVINMDDMLDSALEGIFQQQQQQDADQTTIEANTAVSDDDEGDDEEGDMDLETANAFLDAILSNRQHQQTPNSNNNSQQQQPIPDLLTLMNQMFGTGVGLGLGARNNRNNNNMNVNNNDGQQDSNVQQQQPQQQANAQNPMDFINTLVNNLGVALGGGAANTNMNAATTTGGTADPTNVFSFNLNDVFNQINTGGAQLGDYFLGDNLQQLINHLFDHSGSSGPPPASKRAMDSLPIQKATSEFHDKECTICQDHYQDDEEIVTLPCSHVFHKDCLWPWLNRHGTCPTCRFKLETTEEAPNPDAIDPNQQPTDNNNTNINNNMNANLGAGPMNPFANLFNFAGMPPPNNTNGGPQVFQFSFPFGNPNPNVNNDNNRDNNNTNNNNNNNNNGSGGNMSYFL